MSISEDAWDILDSTADSASGSSLATATVDRLEPLAEEYVSLKRDYDALAERLGQLENEIAHLFPEESGEIAQSTQKYEVIVSRSERWQWDKEALEREFSQEEVPEFVRRTITVDKRKFLKLPQYEQERLKYALTRKLDNPKVKVIPNV